ncbi:MAG: archaemetzincin family Zn-dependent metalloprotease [Thermoproteota archaeon]
MKLSIITISKVDERVISSLVSAISDTMNFDSIQVKPFNRNFSRYLEPSRGQYRSDWFLRLLSTIEKESSEILLGVTELDLYTPGLNYVFGQAELGGNAIISLCRLRPEFYGLKADEHLLLKRAIKEATHEIGHVLGLGHCTSRNCVMFFSNSIIDTNLKSQRFCKSCSILTGGIV